MADDDDTAFIEVDGDLPPLSRSAFMLHSSAIIQSVQDDTPGWIDDIWLSVIKADTTVTVLELETTGLWERERDGYRIHDSETIQMSVDSQETMRRTARECDERGHHLISGTGEQAHCTHCWAPLGRQRN